MSSFKETKQRSLFKAISWRVIALLNSWTILVLNLTSHNFYNALLMNISGFIIFYIFERVWNQINLGKI